MLNRLREEDPEDRSYAENLVKVLTDHGADLQLQGGMIDAEKAIVEAIRHAEVAAAIAPRSRSIDPRPLKAPVQLVTLLPFSLRRDGRSSRSSLAKRQPESLRICLTGARPRPPVCPAVRRGS